MVAVAMGDVRTVAGQQGALEEDAALVDAALAYDDIADVNMEALRAAIRAYLEALPQPAQAVKALTPEERETFVDAWRNSGRVSALSPSPPSVVTEDAEDIIERELIDGLEVEVNIGSENYTFNHRQLAKRIHAALSAPTEGGDAKPVGVIENNGSIRWFNPPIPIGTKLYTHPASKALLEEVGWRDMDGAPKDRTRVLIAVPTKDMDDYIIGEAYFDPENYGDGDWWWAGTDYGDYHAGPVSEVNHHLPTHWMPLPAAPALTKIREGE